MSLLVGSKVKMNHIQDFFPEDVQQSSGELLR